MSSFWKELYNSFVRIRGTPVALIGLVGSACYFLWSSNATTIYVKHLPFWIIFALLLVLTLFDLASRSHALAKSPLPTVRQARVPPPLYVSAKGLLVVDDSPIFAYEALVSIYFLEDEYEMLVGVGMVIAKQRNGLIQILVTNILNESADGVWKKILANESNSLKRVLVKPSIPKTISRDLLQ